MRHTLSPPARGTIATRVLQDPLPLPATRLSGDPGRGVALPNLEARITDPHVVPLPPLADQSELVVVPEAVAAEIRRQVAVEDKGPCPA